MRLVLSENSLNVYCRSPSIKAVLSGLYSKFRVNIFLSVHMVFIGIFLVYPYFMWQSDKISLSLKSPIEKIGL